MDTIEVLAVVVVSLVVIGFLGVLISPRIYNPKTGQIRLWEKKGPKSN